MEKIKRTFGFLLNHPLGKRHLFKSLYRFIYWQLQTSIFPSNLVIKEYLQGIRFYARKGLTGITGNIYSGLHEFNDMAFLLHFLRHEDVFFDIGANVGSYTLLASGVCKSQSIVVEPVPSTFAMLEKNMELNGLHNKTALFNSGAGSQPGILTFTTGNDTTNHVVTGKDNGQSVTIEIPVLTIDSLLSNGLPALIKIDVEGYETEVLKGMSRTLLTSSLKAIIIELNGSGARYGFDDRDIHKLLIEHGFKPFTYDPFQRLLTNLVDSRDFNTIYCRDEDFVNNRIKIAPGFSIMGEII